MTISSFMGPYRFLSNFAPSKITVAGLVYPTVEHAYQAYKSENPDIREMVRLAVTPGSAKRMGRTLSLRPGWEEQKVDAMRYFLQLKFADEFRAHLLANTKPHLLMEGNTWGDKFWGVCRGEGQNMLGKLLMEIRDA